MRNTSDDWLDECMQLIRERAPLLTERFAYEIALGLLAASPWRLPRNAVTRYFEPVDINLPLSVVELPESVPPMPALH